MYKHNIHCSEVLNSIESSFLIPRCSPPADPPAPQPPTNTEDWSELVDDASLCGHLKPWSDPLQRTGPFARCMDIIGLAATQVFYEACRFSVLRHGAGDPETARPAACEAMQALVLACQEEGHTVVWREDTQCCEWQLNTQHPVKLCAA